MGSSLFLKYHTHVDPFHLQNAENDLRDWFKGYNWHLQEHKTDLTELGVVQTDLCDRMLHEKFSNLSKVYILDHRYISSVVVEFTSIGVTFYSERSVAL